VGPVYDEKAPQLDATSSPIVRPSSAESVLTGRKRAESRPPRCRAHGSLPIEQLRVFAADPAGGRPVIPGNSLLALLLQRIGKQLQGESAGSV
jgi:hypothetical protein